MVYIEPFFVVFTLSSFLVDQIFDENIWDEWIITQRCLAQNTPTIWILSFKYIYSRRRFINFLYWKYETGITKD